MNTPIKQVLLAEDNESHAKLVIRNLEDQEIPSNIVHVTDGESALDYLLNRREYADQALYPRPDVILLDLRLPKVDGLDVLKMIKSTESLRNLPVVILSTSSAENDVNRAYELSANSYLVKPIDFDLFTKLLKDFTFYWLGWNRSQSLTT